MFKLIIVAVSLFVFSDAIPIAQNLHNTLLAPFPPGPVRRNIQGGGSERNVAILRQDTDIQPDGSYQWNFEAENGIAAQEQANIQLVGPEQVVKSAQGSYQWTSPEGQNIQISYIADENGYQPQGDSLPTPPPIPAAIQRALEYIAAHPEEPKRLIGR